MSRPALHYTLHVSLLDDTGRITITSPEVPGLLIWAAPEDAFADVHESVKKLRLLNARSEMETEKCDESQST